MGVKDFRRVKTAGAHVTKVKDALALHRGAKCMGSIIYHLEVMLVSNFLNCVDIARDAKTMGRDDSRYVGSDGGFDFACIDVKAIRFDVDKNRLAPLPYNAAGCSDI